MRRPCRGEPGCCAALDSRRQVRARALCATPFSSQLAAVLGVYGILGRWSAPRATPTAATRFRTRCEWEFAPWCALCWLTEWWPALPDAALRFERRLVGQGRWRLQWNLAGRSYPRLRAAHLRRRCGPHSRGRPLSNPSLRLERWRHIGPRASDGTSALPFPWERTGSGYAVRFGLRRSHGRRRSNWISATPLDRGDSMGVGDPLRGGGPMGGGSMGGGDSSDPVGSGGSWRPLATQSV